MGGMVNKMTKVHPVWGDTKPGKGKKTEPVDDPVVEEPEEPVIDDPVVDDPVIEDPVIEDPVEEPDEWTHMDAGKNTSQVITGLTHKTTYGIQVKEYAGDWSDEVLATTLEQSNYQPPDEQWLGNSEFVTDKKEWI
jgi:hypothetical protein